VGVDYTSDMLARAQERVEREGWNNVELIQADAARIELGQTFDASLCTLAISVIPDYHGALARMLAHVRPGGYLAIGDAKRSSRWYGRPFNWVANFLGNGAAGKISRRPWESLREMLKDLHYNEWFMGFFYAAVGRV